MLALQRLHPGQLVQANRAFPLFGSLRGLGVHLTPFTNFLVPLFIGNFCQPIAEPMRLNPPFLSKRAACRGEIREGVAPYLQFVGNFSPRPLADRATSLARCFTCEHCHLAALLCCKLRGRPRTGSILQPFSQTQCLQSDPLESHPAISSQTHRVHIDTQLSRNSCMRRSLSSR
jgi:hypothetical protein